SVAESLIMASQAGCHGFDPRLPLHPEPTTSDLGYASHPPDNYVTAILLFSVYTLPGRLSPPIRAPLCDLNPRGQNHANPSHCSSDIPNFLNLEWPDRTPEGVAHLHRRRRRRPALCGRNL